MHVWKQGGLGEELINETERGGESSWDTCKETTKVLVVGGGGVLNKHKGTREEERCWQG